MSLFLILFCITNLCMPLELSIQCHAQLPGQHSFKNRISMSVCTGLDLMDFLGLD